MSRNSRFIPDKKEQACLDYINDINVIVLDPKYATVSISPQGRFKIGLLSIKNMAPHALQGSGEASSLDLGHQYNIFSGLF